MSDPTPATTTTPPALVPNHKVQPYTSEELVSRINEQSVDPNRLAATVYSLLDSMRAVVAWVNSQIQQPDTGANSSEPESKKRK